jgi:hypothetical protein
VPHILGGGCQAPFVMSATSQWTRSEPFPRRFLFASTAVCEVSTTVMFSYPRTRRSSTSVDSPPPPSMTEAEIPAAAFSIRASEVSRWGRYQLTAFGAFSGSIFSPCVCVLMSITALY